MRIPRIYVELELHPGETLALEASAAHHLARVLRMSVGDRLRLFNGAGREAEAEIITLGRGAALTVRIDRVETVWRESPIEIELVQGLVRAQKFELVLQKAVELGVHAVRPVRMQYSEAGPSRDAAKRLKRWRDIVVHATQQSGRTRLCRVDSPISVDQFETRAATRLMLVPESGQNLRRIELAGPGIAVAIGPEGGIGPRDLERLLALDFQPVAFGPRILRTETAAIAAVVWLQYAFGDLG